MLIYYYIDEKLTQIGFHVNHVCVLMTNSHNNWQW